MTLKQSQGHWTYNEHVETEQGYSHEKFERSHGNSVWEKGNITVLFQTKKKCKLIIISLEHVHKKKKKREKKK